MFLRHVAVNTFCGITEKAVDLGKVNYISGSIGSGKSSFVEAIQKAFTNKSERTEIIRHGEEEATIFIQTDNGMEISRKIRNGKADYLKVSKPGEAVPSTEKFLKQFVNGDVFKPLEFIGKSSVEQAKIILNLLDIPWNMDDIQNWFGECPSVNYEAHILQVLGQIVAFYFEQRASINSEVVVLKAQIAGYRNELPANYDGNEWREKKVAEYYAKVAAAEQTNRTIDSAENLIEGLEGRIATVTAEAEADKAIKKNQMDQKRNEIREFNQFLNEKITEAKQQRENALNSLAGKDEIIDAGMAAAIANIKAEFAEKKVTVRKLVDEDTLSLNLRIAQAQESLAAKAQEFANIDQLEEQALTSLNEKATERIKTEDAKVGNARETLDFLYPINVEPLKLAAERVADMQSYLRDYDLMSSIIREKLAPKEELSKTLTARIEKGREMPKELLKIAALPIPGITVDSNGDIRQDGTLIDGLSEGEQLELAFRVAKAQAGDLKLICLDGWNKINPSDREWIEKEIAEDDFQYLILSTEDGDLNVKIEGEIK